MAENTKIVLDFIAAWKRQDLDEIMGFFTEDCFYHNIPMEPAEGPDAVRGVIEGFLAMAESIVFETLNEVADGDLVLNERVDTFVIGGNPPLVVTGKQTNPGLQRTVSTTNGLFKSVGSLTSIRKQTCTESFCPQPSSATNGMQNSTGPSA